MISGGWLVISFAIFSRSTPVAGSRSNCRLSRSARNSLSFIVASKASRRIFTRSRRNTRSAEHGTPERTRREHDRSQTPARLRSFVFIHQLPNCGGLGQLGITFLSGLNDVSDKTLLAPSVIRLARQERFDGESAAVNLATLNGEIDFRSPWIALHKVELRSDSFLEEFR